MKERIQKLISQSGTASRRQAEILIKNGNVRVNGVIAKLGDKASFKDAIVVNEVPISKEQHKYFLFYKPRRVVSTVRDEHDRAKVTDYFQGIGVHVYPVGRLDYDTSGLILLTNDGEFAQAMMHPKFKIDKTYQAKVEGQVDFDALNKLRRGVKIDGRLTSPANAKLIKTDLKKNTSLVELTIHEGRNHQVKKMFEMVKHPVTKLKRLSYGNLDLTGLNSGEFRELSKHEIADLIHLSKGEAIDEGKIKK